MPIRTYSSPEDFQEWAEAYLAGRVYIGDISLYHFDMGVIETLGAQMIDGAFYLTNVKGMSVEAGQPGVPIYFQISDDLYKTHKLPSIVIRRTTIAAALNRWHPGTLQYRIPAKTAQQVEHNGIAGYSHYEEQQQAVPYDITYSIVIQARNRAGVSSFQINHAEALRDYVWRIYQPRSCVYVRDFTDKGEDKVHYRGYTVLADDISPESQVLEVTGRIIGYSMSITVQAHIDLNKAVIRPAVISSPTLSYQQKDS